MIDFDALVLQPCAEAFGSDQGDWSYLPRGGAAVPIVGIYMAGYETEVLLDNGEPGFATCNPMLGVRAAQFARDPEEGEEVRSAVLGKAFKIQNVKPDGVGDIKLELNFAADLP